MTKPPPLRVAALVDLKLSDKAGGHVKCWQRLARAATVFPDELDLSVFFSGDVDSVERLSKNVRYVVRRPVFSTERIPFLSHVPDHTDLAPFHARLARDLRGFDVLHTTDAYFAFARTAERVSRRGRVPMINSVHTDTPGYTRVFTERTVERMFGRGFVKRILIDGIGVHDWAARNMARRLADHQIACKFALVSRDEERAAAVLPPERVGLLRRGVDTDLFSPEKNDREWLEATHGIPRDRILIYFAGRLNRGKNVMTLAYAVRTLLDRGENVHLLCAGDGEDKAVIETLLGRYATCPGVVDEALAARFFASADIFALPSEIEVFGNVVLEALAAGTPVVVAKRGGMGRILNGDGFGFAIDGGTDAWAATLSGLMSDRVRLVDMGRAARSWALENLPTWSEVLREDLMIRWLAAAEQRGTGRVR